MMEFTFQHEHDEDDSRRHRVAVMKGNTRLMTWQKQIEASYAQGRDVYVGRSHCMGFILCRKKDGSLIFVHERDPENIEVVAIESLDIKEMTTSALAALEQSELVENVEPWRDGQPFRIRYERDDYETKATVFVDDRAVFVWQCGSNYYYAGYPYFHGFTADGEMMAYQRGGFHEPITLETAPEQDDETSYDWEADVPAHSLASETGLLLPAILAYYEGIAK